MFSSVGSMIGWAHDTLGAASFAVYLHPSLRPPLSALDPLWSQHQAACLGTLAAFTVRGVRGNVLPAPGMAQW
jgi:hypothetical protein